MSIVRTIFNLNCKIFDVLKFFSKGLTDWEDSDIISQVLATSQEEYLDSLKQSRLTSSASSESSEKLDSNNS